MSRRFDIAFAGFMMAGGLQIMAADGVEASLYPCVQVLVVPPFGPIAYLGDASRQPVTATALIGNGGILSDVGFSEGSESHHRFEINEYLKRSTFNPSCAGKRVQVVFSFRIEGAPDHIRRTRVEFRPPNHFVLITNPAKAIVDRELGK